MPGIVGVVGAIFLSGVSKDRLKEALKYVEKKAIASTTPVAPPPAVPVKLKENLPWDGFITLSEDEESR